MLRSIAIWLSILLPPAAMAGTVTLSSFDSSLQIEGELLYFDGEVFRLETKEGPVTIEAGGFHCIGTDCPAPEELIARVTLSGPADMVHRLMPALLSGFAAKKGWIFRNRFLSDQALEWEISDGRETPIMVLEAKVSDEESGIKALADGEIDLALGRSFVKGGLRQVIVALDALVPVVAPDNPQVMITVGQIEQIFSGAIDNWSYFGGGDLPIQLHLPTEKRLLNPLRTVIPAFSTPNSAILHSDHDEMADAISSEPSAIGLLPVSMIGNAVPLVLLGDCGLATPATASTIKSKDYPLMMPLFLYRDGVRQHRLVRNFFEFAASREAQPIVRAAGFLDQSIGRLGFAAQGDRLANAVLAAGDNSEAVSEVQRMIGRLVRADRLTVAFRFQDGSSDLDFQSAGNVLRLSDAISRGDIEGEIIFAGFSDGVGTPEGNKQLSQQRASSISRAVLANTHDTKIEYSTEAFGETMPLACDDTAWGREINRRVEVWVR